MFTKVLWATDGSVAADSALPVAKSIAQTYGAKLVVVHVSEIAARSPLSVPAVEVTDDALKAALRRRVEELEQEGITAGFVAPDLTLRGTAHTIAEVAREEGADLIVVGTRGSSQLVRALVGSVTQRLLALAPCAVLAVPPREDTEL